MDRDHPQVKALAALHELLELVEANPPVVRHTRHLVMSAISSLQALTEYNHLVTIWRRYYTHCKHCDHRKWVEDPQTATITSPDPDGTYCTVPSPEHCPAIGPYLRGDPALIEGEKHEKVGT